MQRPNLILVLLSAVLFNIQISAAQFTEEQIRTLPVEVRDAKLVGQDLYIASSEGLYHTDINNIDFRRIYSYSIGNMTQFGDDRLFFAASTSTSPDPSYCNGDVIQFQSITTAQSLIAGSRQVLNSKSYTHYGLSITSMVNRGINATENGTIYSIIYQSHPQSSGPSGSAKVFDIEGNSLGSTAPGFSDFASDDQYYYALRDNNIFRSESPLIGSSVALTITGTPRVNRIFNVNGQLFAVGDSYFVSEDHGESWTEFDYPHTDLSFDKFEDGLYYFTDVSDSSFKPSKKLRLSTNSFFSTNYDTIYDVRAEPFLDNLRLKPLSRDTLLAFGDNSIFTSFDRGATWQEIFAGLWHSSISKPAITDQARFFQDGERFYRTMDEGLSYEEYTPNFISTLGTTPDDISSLSFTGHHNVLFCDVRYENGTQRLFRSTDQGDTFIEEFDSDLRNFFNGDDDVFAITDGILYTSANDGDNWTTLNITEIADDYNRISDIQQESDIVLVEYPGAYYISYDAGVNFSNIEVPDDAFYSISLENGNIFGIGNRGSTWLKTSESSGWTNTNPEASFFNTHPNQSSYSASKIYSNGGSTIYSRFNKCGVIPELCQSTCLTKVHSSDDFGQTWQIFVPSGNFTFTHNEDHYRYSPGFYKFSNPQAIDTVIHFESLELCEGESYNGIQINQDTTLETSSEGLLTYDIYITEIMAIPNVTDTIQTILCEGSTIMYNNVEYNSPGLYFTGWLQTAAHGCDSLVFLNVQEVETHVNNTSLEIEAGEQFEGIEIFQDTTITLVFSDANGCDSLEIFEISVLNTTNTSQQIDSPYTLSPNPTSDRLHIASSNLNQIIDIEVIDLSGKKISILPPTSSSKLEVDLSKLPQGIYFITIYDKQGRYTEKIVKL